jgi:ketol-acid reductoisomerase
MKKGSTLSYSHGFNIVEEECKFAKTLLLLCVQNVLDPKYVRSIKRFGVPTLIAVHPENDPNGDGFEQAKPMP